ncbi:MAG: hypothetical protein M3336_04430 [Chloroflexota bacterium]|nr:hypothetical protein [Chloroflexota bacterium]
MVTMFWSYRVGDWDAWSSTVVALRDDPLARERRERYGLRRRRVFRSVDDPNELMFVAEFNTREGAEALLRDPDGIRRWYEQTGLEVFPPVLITEEVADGLYEPASGGSGTAA